MGQCAYKTEEACEHSELSPANHAVTRSLVRARTFMLIVVSRVEHLFLSRLTFSHHQAKVKATGVRLVQINPCDVLRPLGFVVTLMKSSPVVQFSFSSTGLTLPSELSSGWPVDIWIP